MGFGLLLCAFTMLICFSAFEALPVCIGYFIGIYALLKLSEYEPGFKITAAIYSVISVYSLTKTIMELCILFTGNTVLLDLSEKMNMVDETLFYVGQLALLPPLISITKDTGRRKNVFACRRNAVIFVLFFAFWIFSNVMIGRGSLHASKYALFIMISRYIVMLLNVIQLYSCYMWICPEGEEELEMRENEVTESVMKHFNKNRKEKSSNKKQK